ncbi:indolepyruvate ferredoxin oxidoreductase subunit alpha [Eubacteriaceae bacterium ES3]|nr:indolepyruvate ferredoxin oxidoreductase subunit alpha [Eubacteriaceae bacterium ES3]
MKKLLTGNEAVARGAWEAGVKFASAYPGTPSTEILENVATYEEIVSEWAPNEKVALESVAGAVIAGVRSLCAMKHVGVNVAADPLFTLAYLGVNGGAVLISADEPGMHSSQNEQDNRHYARHAKVAMFEPSDSQEVKDMIKEAYVVSETYDLPVLFRLTTRVCHSKSIVSCDDRLEIPDKVYEKNVPKYCPLPAFSRQMLVKLNENFEKLNEYSNTTAYNYIEDNQSKIGVIGSGVAFQYAKEVFGDTVSYLKIGFSYPLPMEKIKQFAEGKETLYIFEENDPIMETEIKAAGIQVIGKDKLPSMGELTPDRVRQALSGETKKSLTPNPEMILPRPPALCAGCPHRGVFYELGKRKDLMIFSDIGCYSLGLMAPYNATDAMICMGASISGGHGVAKAFAIKGEQDKKVVSILGDSTFFHSGITSLLNVAYNNSNTLTIILDNRITGMTGHQENPGSGYDLKGEPATMIDIATMVNACGIKNVKTVDPNDLDAVKGAIEWGINLSEPAVLITRWPCVLKKMSQEDKEEFPEAFKKVAKVDIEACIGCKKCLKSGCPALAFDRENKKSGILAEMCVGCGVCAQICPKQAIKVEAR